MILLLRVAGVTVALLQPLRELGEGVEGVDWGGAISKSRDRGYGRGTYSNRSSRSIAYCATLDSGLQFGGLPNDRLNYSFNWATVVAATVVTKRSTLKDALIQEILICRQFATERPLSFRLRCFVEITRDGPYCFTGRSSRCRNAAMQWRLG